MLHFGGNEEHTARGYFPVVIPSSKARLSANYVVHLVFMMRPLRVSSSRGEHIESRTHRRQAKKFTIQLLALSPLLVNLFDVRKQRLHARIPPNPSSVYFGTRWFVCRSPSGLYHW